MKRCGINRKRPSSGAAIGDGIATQHDSNIRAHLCDIFKGASLHFVFLLEMERWL